MATHRLWFFLCIVTFFAFISEHSIAGPLITKRGVSHLPWLILFLDRETPVETLSLVTPYVNESDMKEIRSGFSTDIVRPPWNYVHDGFDIYPNIDPTHPDFGLKPFQAVCSGKVDWIYAGDEQVIVWLTCNSIYTIEINFETQAAGTGQIQLANIVVTEGQVVSQGDLIGYHYAPNDKAHVHFSLYRNWLTSCPQPYFTQQARDSMLGLIHVLYPQNTLMCYGDDPSPPPLYAPYVNMADMSEIRSGFSSAGTDPPWGTLHGGLDIYTLGDLKTFQAVCAGTVDTLELQQDSYNSNWKVQVLIQCDDYVTDPADGGYFIPFSANYLFEPTSTSLADGQVQLANISVIQGQQVSQGDLIGSLKMINASSHLHFGLEMFASSFFAQFGAESIPICPEPHFSATASASVQKLLYTAWPSSSMCYY